MTLTKHNFYVGCETGIFKGVNSFKNNFDNLNSLSELNRDKAVNVICWKNDEQTQICMGLRNGTVNVYDTEKSEFVKTYNFDIEKNRYTGIAPIGRKIITCLDNGKITVWKKSEPLKSLWTGTNVTRMRQHPNKPAVIMTGGDENELKIWDLNNSGKPLFQAKNVQNDFLGLRVPVWVTDMAYMHDGRRVAICTRHHQIRVYDPSCKMKRPVIDVSIEDYPLTSLAISNRDECIVTGSSQGRMFLFDTRKKAILKRFRGFSGSVQDIVCHPTLPIVASCSIDRFLRIHDTNDAQLLNKVYLKSRLSCLLMRNEYRIDSKEAGVEEDEDVDSEEYDELWDKMPSITPGKRKGDDGKKGTSKKWK